MDPATHQDSLDKLPSELLHFRLERDEETPVCFADLYLVSVRAGSHSGALRDY